MVVESEIKPGISEKLNGFVQIFGKAAAWLNFVLIGAIMIQVVSRYVFKTNFIKLEEIQWHLYSIGVMFGLSYATTKNAQIRLDVLHAGFSTYTKNIIEILGILFLLMPMIFVFFIHSLDFVAESWQVGECSDAPTGLCYRWVIKSIIPFSFILLFLAALSRLIAAFHGILAGKKR